jgi:hypothetical protein
MYERLTRKHGVIGTLKESERSSRLTGKSGQDVGSRRCDEPESHCATAFASNSGVRSGLVATRLRLPTAIAVVTLLVAVQACGSSTRTPSATASVSSATPTALIEESPSDVASPSPSETPVITYADLDGLPTTPELAHKQPIAVMIDDSDAARPQSGLSTASIVYQSPANGGVDRYMAVFQEGQASSIGPVRSVRQYFAKWASEYHAVLSHYGADPRSISTLIPALSKKGAIYNLDGLAGSNGAYHRVSTKPAPHNVYTSSAVLLQWISKKGYPATFAGVPMRPFADDLPLAQRPASGSITVPYRNQTIGYTYVPSTDSYLRSVNAKAQVDPANGQQVMARNVIVLFQSIATDMQKGDNYGEPIVGQIGKGDALVFRDGQEIKATWKKANDTDLTRLYDSSGHEIALVRGETFIQVVVLKTKVSYKTS